MCLCVCTYVVAINMTVIDGFCRRRNGGENAGAEAEVESKTGADKNLGGDIQFWNGEPTEG